MSAYHFAFHRSLSISRRPPVYACIKGAVKAKLASPLEA
jgi:hypothetical protein